jgi:hypothetical protein
VGSLSFSICQTKHLILFDTSNFHVSLELFSIYPLSCWYSLAIINIPLFVPSKLLTSTPFSTVYMGR